MSYVDWLMKSADGGYVDGKGLAALTRRAPGQDFLDVALSADGGATWTRHQRRRMGSCANSASMITSA